jgi:transcriptional regulator GlxA family with amidase domain
VTRRVLFVLFDGAEELDWAGPWEVLTMLGQVEQGSVVCEVVAESAGPVRCAKGLRVLPDHAFAAAPQANVLLVPGGQGTRREATNPVMLDFVRGQAERADVVTSVCTGSFVLAAAGLLAGKRATTHWGSMDRLRAIEGVTAVEERWVDEGSVVTAAGVSAGIDMALHLLARDWSPEVAARVRKAMQYYPAPPGDDVALPEWSR